MVLDDDEMIVELLDNNNLKYYDDGIVMLLEIISLQTSVGVIVDLSSSSNRIFLLVCRMDYTNTSKASSSDGTQIAHLIQMSRSKKRVGEGKNVRDNSRTVEA